MRVYAVSGLTSWSKRAVQQFVVEVRCEQGVSILLTTYDMDEAEKLCDRIGFLVGGELIAEGTPRELRTRVATDREVADVDMEDVFLELTGRRIEEDEDEDEMEASAR